MASVTFVNRFFYPDHSATSQLLSDLAFHLAVGKNTIKIITSRQLYDQESVSLSGHEVLNSVEIHRIWTTRFGRSNLVGRSFDYLSFYISAFLFLLFKVKKGGYLVVKTDPPMISLVARIVSFVKPVKLINWNQDLFPEVGTELGVGILKFLKPVLVLLRNYTLRTAYANVVIGETMKGKLISCGVSEEKIFVIQNWSDGSSVYSVDKESNALRKEWGLSDKFIVGYSGNMGRAHEFMTILDIAEALKHLEDVVFLFIGSGARKSFVVDEVGRRGLRNFIFKPYQDRSNLAISLSVPDVHVISLLPALEGLIVPSKYSGVAAVGRPCLFIGDPDGEIPRMLKEADCGHSIHIGDVQSGVDYLLKIWDYKEELSRQGKNARQLFIRRFDAGAAYAAWNKLLS